MKKQALFQDIKEPIKDKQQIDNVEKWAFWLSDQEEKNMLQESLDRISDMERQIDKRKRTHEKSPVTI